MDSPHAPAPVSLAQVVRLALPSGAKLRLTKPDDLDEALIELLHEAYVLGALGGRG